MPRPARYLAVILIVVFALDDTASPFSPAHADGLEVWFRAAAGRMPDVLEIGVRGRRHPRVEAYWDGCSFAL